MSLFRFFARKLFASAVLFCLLTALLFTGCKPEPDDPVVKFDENLIGRWISTGEWGYDGYIITSNHISYVFGNDSSTDISFAGTIRYASQFKSDAGVIIIEYDNAHKQKYYSGDSPKGDFLGIYYESLKPGVSVKMGGAFIGGTSPAEEKTLDAAIKAFTMDNESSYMSYYGTYSKQP